MSEPISDLTNQAEHNPETYREMLVPHESPEVAAAAWAEFWGDVYEARKKHRITDVVMVGQLWAKTPRGEECFRLVGGMGAESNIVTLLAWAYGKTSADQVKTWAELAAQREQADQPQAEDVSG